MRLILLVLSCLLLTSCADPTPAPEPPKQATGVASMRSDAGRDVPDWRALEHALAKDPASVIPVEFLDLVGGEAAFKASVPAGAYFEVREKTWRPNNSGGGLVTIAMMAPNQTPDLSVAVLMEDVQHRWYVVQTLPVDEASKTGSKKGNKEAS